MKKTKLLILSACVSAMMLAGCNGSAATVAESATEAVTEAETAEETTAEEETAEEETTEEETPAVSEAEAALTPGIGTWDGNTYTNEFAELTFHMPEDWIAATDEEIAAVMGIGAEVLADSGLQVNEKLLEMQSLYAMMAQNPTTNTNINLTFENLGIVIGGSKTTEEEYIEILKSSLAQVQNMNYEFGEISEMEVGGNTYKVLEGTLADYGITQYYCIRKVDKTMIAMIATVVGDDTIEDILDCFE